MTTRIEVKPDEYGWTDMPSYGAIVETFGEILVESSEDDYQGDSLYAIKAGDRYGFLTFGWGSCSGCDALQACDTQEELNSLQDDLERGIIWRDSWAELKEYIASVDPSDTFMDKDLLATFRTAVAARGDVRPDGSE